MLYLVLGLCEDASSSCRKLITPFQFASQTCENFRISKLSGIGMQLTSTSQVGMGDLSWTFEHEFFLLKHLRSELVTGSVLIITIQACTIRDF